MKINFALALFLLFYSIDGISQIINLSSNNICDGECIVRTEVIKYFEYTGIYFMNNNIREEKINISGKRKQWVKKKQDPNCLSPNPDECLVWCLVETPEEYIKVYIVNDTNAVKEFKIRSLLKSNLNSDDLNQTLPVICEDEIPSQLINHVTNALVKDEYLDEYKIYKKINRRFRKALEMYQEDNDLPVGYLNLKTLDHMKIKYIIE